MNTASLKLPSGEEIIGRVKSQNEDVIVLTHVRTIGLQQDREGRFGVGMVDYVVSNKDCALTFKTKDAIVLFEPSPEIEKAYLSQTSGIQLS